MVSKDSSETMPEWTQEADCVRANSIVAMGGVRARLTSNTHTGVSMGRISLHTNYPRKRQHGEDVYALNGTGSCSVR